MKDEIWTWVHPGENGVMDPAPALIGEARRLADSLPDGHVTAIVMGGDVQESVLLQLGCHGADKILYLQNEALARFQGELFAKVLLDVVKPAPPRCLLFAHDAESAELAGRLGAMLPAAVITGAGDLTIDEHGRIRAVRPKANGYLFEKLEVMGSQTALVTFPPSVLARPEPVPHPGVYLERIIPDVASYALKTHLLESVAADPEGLTLEEADIVVAGGRGVGRDEAFGIIHELARVIGGTVGGTRPVIDWRTLPFEKQIGQTGKTVSPGLIINCGISGANEYTAGIEQSQRVIAINTDPRARIFRFADLGVIGDLHEILPVLIHRLETLAAGKTNHQQA